MGANFVHAVTCKSRDEESDEEHTFTSFVYKARWFVLAQTDGQELEPITILEWDAERAMKALGIERVPFDHTNLKKAFGTACRIAGIRDLHWHDLRHTFGTRLAEAGCSEATIASLMGHSDPQTTRRYTHATDRAKRAAVEAVRVLRENVCHKSATTAERLPKLAAVSA